MSHPIDSAPLSRITGVYVRPTRIPSGLNRRVTVWPQGAFFVSRRHLGFEFSGGLGHIPDIKFEPGGGRRQIGWPFAHAKTGLSDLRKRPESEGLDSLKLFSMQ